MLDSWFILRCVYRPQQHLNVVVVFFIPDNERRREKRSKLWPFLHLNIHSSFWIWFGFETLTWHTFVWLFGCPHEYQSNDANTNRKQIVHNTHTYFCISNGMPLFVCQINCSFQVFDHFSVTLFIHRCASAAAKKFSYFFGFQFIFSFCLWIRRNIAAFLFFVQQMILIFFFCNVLYLISWNSIAFNSYWFVWLVRCEL